MNGNFNKQIKPILPLAFGVGASFGGIVAYLSGVSD